MFHLIKLIVLIFGLAAIAYFALPHFGYEVNMSYFTESKERCQQRILNECPRQIIEQGTKNAKCDLNCVDPKLIIKKQQ